jgi:hypothetical protein
VKHLNDLRGAAVFKLITAAFGADGVSWCGRETTVHTGVTESQLAFVGCIDCLERFAEWYLDRAGAALEVRERLQAAAEKPS